MESLDDDVARFRSAAATLSARDIAHLDAAGAAAAHRELRTACDLVLAFAARLLSKVEEDGRWASSGARTFPEWVARQRGGSVGMARAEATLGKALTDDLPDARRAVSEGGITLEHVEVLARFGPTSDARRAALRSDLPDRNEAALVAKAAGMGVDDFRRELKRWAMRVDEASAEREHSAAQAKEYLSLARRPDGVSIQGFLTVEHGDVLATALRAVIGVPAQDDARTPEQRRAAALTDVSRLVLDKGLAGGGGQVRPHISVHVSWDAFARLAEQSAARQEPENAGRRAPVAPAELDDGEPIPASVLARIACDSEVTRIVFGPTGLPLDVGRAQRTFTGAQRRAVIARDRTCCYPGCRQPPAVGEVHHVAWWARDGGPTAVSNGVLLCWYHHDLVHARNLGIMHLGDGEWEFRRADESLVPAPGSGSRPCEAPPDGSPHESQPSDRVERWRTGAPTGTLAVPGHRPTDVGRQDALPLQLPLAV